MSIYNVGFEIEFHLVPSIQIDFFEISQSKLEVGNFSTSLLFKSK